MKMSPEMIDGFVIQLRSVFKSDDSIPEKVRKSGMQLVNDLDEWSEELKKGKVAVPANMPEAK